MQKETTKDQGLKSSPNDSNALVARSRSVLKQLLEYADITPKDNEHTSYDLQLKLVELFNIERRQLIDSYDAGFVDGCCFQGGKHYKNFNSEQYFNDNFDVS